MSCMFGRWNFGGKPVEDDFLDKIEHIVAPYGPDGRALYRGPNLAILFHAFHTTERSRRATQPYKSKYGDVLTWDGHLDNAPELISELRNRLNTDATDIEVVAAAYDQWGTRCLARLLGDWALAIWNPITRSLLLAKDALGVRHLYYCIDKDGLTWSTILDPLVLLTGKTLKLSEEYIAAWFSFFPALHLTPYVGIHSVSPASFVILGPGKHTVERYWEFDPTKRVRYHTDRDYEQHFLSVFEESVRRRLRSCNPVLSELSGGMDSSSIVCMADTIIAANPSDFPRLDTVSYYDDSEPNWNERPFFTKVEEKRGSTGCHIDISARTLFPPDYSSFAAVPGSIDRKPRVTSEFAEYLRSNGNRVVLSGIGGDEVMGGVPTPVPELANLLARGRFIRLAHQLKLWALDKKKPWFYLLFETLREFIPPSLIGVPKYKRPAEWLDPAFIKRNRSALQGYQHRIKLEALPSFQFGVHSVETLRRELECFVLPSRPTYETRYPYLDRDLLEFMFAIPREQLVRPGQRRSLMRRALVGIVPVEVLDRKRKAFMVRGPMTAISDQWAGLLQRTSAMVSGSLGIVDVQAFERVLQQAHDGVTVPLVTVMRTFTVEVWLTSIKDYLSGVDDNLVPTTGPRSRSPLPA